MVRLVWWSVKRMASSFTTPCWGGVTSVQVAVGGDAVSLNVMREIWVPAMYMATPRFQSVPSEGSPALVRLSTSAFW